MFPYTNRARGQDKQQNFELARGCTYDLQSVVVHVGNLESGESSSSLACRRHTDDLGHYVSYSRVGNQWLKFNDHTVTLASKSPILCSIFTPYAILCISRPIALRALVQPLLTAHVYWLKTGFAGRCVIFVTKSFGIKAA